jgi:hypothetical protein
MTQKIHQVELTSKKWKVLKVISLVIMFIIAPIFYGNNNSIWGTIFTIGILVYIVARVGAWWYHG